MHHSRSSRRRIGLIGLAQHTLCIDQHTPCCSEVETRCSAAPCGRPQRNQPDRIDQCINVPIHRSLWSQPALVNTLGKSKYRTHSGQSLLIIPEDPSDPVGNAKGNQYHLVFPAIAWKDCAAQLCQRGSFRSGSVLPPRPYSPLEYSLVNCIVCPSFNTCGWSLALVSEQGLVGADDGRWRKTIGELRHFGWIIILLNIICAAHHDVAVSVLTHVRVHASRAYHS